MTTAAGTSSMGSAFDELATLVHSDHPLQAVLDQVAELAKRALPAAAEVSITLVDKGVGGTISYTGALALLLDERQYSVGYGPCLDAARDGGERPIDDMAADTQWPLYSATAVEAGVLSSLALPLAVAGEVIGALNAYATEPGAFDKGGIDAARKFASYAAVALTNARMFVASRELAAQLQQAMASRAQIEQAKGILMGQRRCDADAAFQILRGISQHVNMKLRDVAEELIADAVQPMPR